MQPWNGVVKIQMRVTVIAQTTTTNVTDIPSQADLLLCFIFAFFTMANKKRTKAVAAPEAVETPPSTQPVAEYILSFQDKKYTQTHIQNLMKIYESVSARINADNATVGIITPSLTHSTLSDGPDRVRGAIPGRVPGRNLRGPEEQAGRQCFGFLLGLHDLLRGR